MHSLDFKSKGELIKKIAKQYRMSNFKLYMAGHDINQKTDKSMVDFINYVLQELDQESQRIIINDYFEKNAHDWYLDYYQRSTYYKLKKQALDDFLRCLQM